MGSKIDYLYIDLKNNKIGFERWWLEEEIERWYDLNPKRRKQIHTIVSWWGCSSFIDINSSVITLSWTKNKGVKK